MSTSEEITNQKQLAKAVGTLCASSRVATGGGKPLAALEASLHIAPGCRARFVDPAGGLRGWIEMHHAADFAVLERDAVVLVELTDGGAAKYAARDMQEAPRGETAETMASQVTDGMARDARSAVFAELALVAGERYGAR